MSKLLLKAFIGNLTILFSVIMGYIGKALISKLLPKVLESFFNFW